jgi:ribonucleotide reductase alpha subunit
MRHRTLGIGAQGLADVYHKMKLAWGVPDSRELNLMIFETIYYAALVESCEIARELYQSYATIARKEGKVKVIVDYQSRPIIHKTTVVKYDGNSNAYQRPKFNIEYIVEPIYKEFVLAGQPNPDNLPILPKTAGAYCSFVGSPLSAGKFHFDLKNEESDYMNEKNAKFVASMNPECKSELEESLGEPLLNFLHRKKITPSKLWEWESLREKIKTFGVRNAQLIALMPTSSTSQILGNNECIEPYTENMYKRTTLAGDFIVVNPYLIKELCDLKLWNESVENNIKINNGSVQYLEIPIDDIRYNKLNDIKFRYRTAYEMSQKILIEDAADRQFFVDQAQSLNLHNNNVFDLRTIIGMHFLGWARGLKTGMYYLRSRQAMTAQKFTISAKEVEQLKKTDNNLLSYESIQQDKKRAQLSLENPEEACLSCSS